MEQIRRIKVVMVCHLSNSNIRSHLPLENGKYINSLRGVLGHNRQCIYKDFAPWNTSIANYLGGRNDVDFFIISPHQGMRKLRVSYTENNVNYVFLNYQLSSLFKRFVKGKKLWRKINPFSHKVKKEIEQINPDLVVLMGTENSYYSSTIIGITKYPVFVMCQTVYNNPERKLYGKVNKENAETEMDIFKEFRYVGVYCKLHYDLVRILSPQSIIFKFGFPTSAKMLEPKETDKEFDFVNFALTMDSRKGYPDSIQALAIVKRKYPGVKLNLIGQCINESRKEYENMIIDLGLQDNVVFTPFFEKQSDLFKHIQKSRFAILPCKVDNISGTMNQSMQLGLPIVVYRTTGTPSFNKEKPCALIAEKENVQELAQHMISLMSDPKLAEMLRINARELQEKKYKTALHNGDHIVKSFNAIINHFRNGTPIPEDLLFNPEIDD